jgi:ubiquitin conjugation factor E4 B
MDVDPLTSGSSTTANSVAIPPGDLLPFLNDLAVGFASDTLADVITPTLSLFFQQWFTLSPSPDLLGSEWRRYLGAVAVLVQVKGIASLVRCPAFA